MFALVGTCHARSEGLAAAPREAPAAQSADNANARVRRPKWKIERGTLAPRDADKGNTSILQTRSLPSAGGRLSCRARGNTRALKVRLDFNSPRVAPARIQNSIKSPETGPSETVTLPPDNTGLPTTTSLWLESNTHMVPAPLDSRDERLIVVVIAVWPVLIIRT